MTLPITFPSAAASGPAASALTVGVSSTSIFADSSFTSSNAWPPSAAEIFSTSAAVTSDTLSIL